MQKDGAFSVTSTQRQSRQRTKKICILLFKDGMSEVAKKRLDVFVNNDDGFVIAEEDLK